MIRAVIGMMVVASAAGVAQAAGAPAFEVASVRVSQQGREVIDVAPGSLTMRNIRLAACIGWAYDLQDFQISGPGWINEEWFDITAKAAAPVKESELRAMLQTLIAERFQLTFHRQKKEMQALVLTVGKTGHKLQPTDVEGSPSFKTGKMNLTGQGATVAQLASFLSNALRNPVIDQTGLTGRFNYFLDVNAYVTEEMRKNAGPPPEADSIIAQAVQAQLGLKVDSQKAPVEVLVIDHMEKTPSEN